MRIHTILLALSLMMLAGSASANNSVEDMQRQKRKKVAVVLSGGGAKGSAHVSALKVIEEAGIPVDMVVGTSMGAIVGALYCSGYTTDQLDSLIRVQNWGMLLTDAIQRSDKNMDVKQREDRYIVSATFDKSPTEVIEGGLLKANKIGKFFTELTADYHDSIDYSTLPIPFACVATDIVTGQEVDMHSGILAESMRASMAIPGAFPPIKKGNRILVDGGLVNNYPVDVARSMGADIVIGVDVTEKEKKPEEINSTVDVLMRILDVICSNKHKENVEMTDVRIIVNVRGYSSASFSKEAIDTLMARGETAAREKWNELQALKTRIGRIESRDVRQPKHIASDTTVTPVATIYRDHMGSHFLGLGARFDNEELATLLIGGSYEFDHAHQLKAGFEARLGKRRYGKVTVSVIPIKRWSVCADYKMSRNETKVYNEGVHMANLDYSEESASLYFQRSWRKMLISFGGEWTYSKYNNLLSQTDWVDFVQTRDIDKSVVYYANIAFDSQNSHAMPRSGMEWNVRYSLFTENFHKYDNGLPLHIVEGYFNMAIPVSSKFTVMPSVSGRILPNRNTHLNNLNVIGGTNSNGHYMRHQISFAGINYIQIVPNNILVLGAKVRYNFVKNSYLFSNVNYGLAGNAIEDIATVNSNNLYGAAAGYGYKAPFGPIELNINWSNVTKSVGSFLNIGYMF